MKTKIMIALAFIILLSGCGKDPVTLVKQGTLDIDKSVTIDNVSKGYKFFKNTEWNTFTDSQKRTIVQFKSLVDIDAYKDSKLQYFALSSDDIEYTKTLVKDIHYIAQFAINQDGKTFQVKYIGLDCVGINGKEASVPDQNDSMLKSLYKNQLDDQVFMFLLAVCQDTNARAEHFSGTLKNLIGKSPDTVFSIPELDAKLRRVLNDKYDYFKQCLNVSSDVTGNTEFAEGSGCLPHACGVSESYFCVTKYGKMYAAVLKNDEVEWFGDDKDWPSPLISWIKGQGVDFK